MTDSPRPAAPLAVEAHASRSPKMKGTRGAPRSTPRGPEKKLHEDVRIQLRKAVLELGPNNQSAEEPAGSVAFVYCYSRFLDSKRLASWLRKDLIEALTPFDEARLYGLLRILNLLLRSRLSMRRILHDDRFDSLVNLLCRANSDRVREEATRIKCSILDALRRRASLPSAKRHRGLQSGSAIASPALSSQAKQLPFWAHHIETLADMLCAIEWQHLSRLHFTDFTIRGKGAALRSYIERTNLLSEWVATNILVQRSAKQQCHIFGNYVRIAHKCLENSGFNVASAIISGCRHACVERLHRTWHIPRSYSYVYEVVGTAVSPTRGYAAYRASLEAAIKSNKPFLPIVALILRDLTLIEDGNPDVLDERRVNVEKLQSIHKALAPVLRAAQLPYKRPEGEGLETIVRHLTRLPCRPAAELEALSGKFRPWSRSTQDLLEESSMSVRSADSDDARASGSSDVNVSELVELALDSEASSSSDPRR